MTLGIFVSLINNSARAIDEGSMANRTYLAEDLKRKYTPRVIANAIK